MDKFIFAAIAVLWAGSAMAQTVNVAVSEDSWVNQANPGANYGSNTYLSVKDRSGVAQSYLKVASGDLAALSGPVASASLWIYQYQATYSPGDTINLHVVTADWSEGALTWDNKPASGALAVSTLTLNGGNECWREFTGLEGLLAAWSSGDNYGLMLENDVDGIQEELFARFYSSESGAEHRPFLSITMESPVTAAPEPLSAVLFSLGGVVLARKRKKGCPGHKA